MFCPNCGYENPPGRADCISCGAALSAGTAASRGYGAAPVAEPAGPKPPNHLVWAILATLFCCLPTGIAAIVFAAQVDGRYAAGDYRGALQSSANARTWCWVSFGLGLAFIALYACLALLGALAG